jgi:copper oxidase (laccase) domain-containing protein
MTGGSAGLNEVPVPGSVPRFEIPDWRERYGVVAGITGRGNGFDLGLASPDSTARVTARWRELFGALGDGFPCHAVGRQIHEATIARHDGGGFGWLIMDGVDGHLSTARGVLLCVTVADCVPVYLLHPPSGAVSLLHAGWRGIAAGILECGVERVLEAGNGAPSDIVMHCGIAICGSCYEVDSEVHAAVRGVAADRGPLDLRAQLARRAQSLGITRLTSSGWCSAHDGDRFFSHRRSRGSDGRMVAYLGVPLA